MIRFCNFIFLFLTVANSGSGFSNAFMDWCEYTNAPINVASTIEYLLRYSNTTICADANQYLENLASLVVVAPAAEFDLRPIADFHNIRDLSLNGFIADIGILERLTFLKDLRINYTSLSSLDGLEKLRFLKVLRLDNNYNLSSIAPLQRLRSLQELEIVGADSFSAAQTDSISTLTQLQSIKISDSYDWDAVAFAQQLTTLPNVQDLTLDNVNLRSVGEFAEIKNLKSLAILWNESLTNFAALEKMPRLQNLLIERSNLTDIASFTNLSSLRTLALRYTYLHDASGLGEIKTLENIDLTGNLQLANLPPLSKITNLKTLNISGTGIRSIDFVRGAESLVELIAVDCRIEDLSPLDELKNLKVLRL